MSVCESNQSSYTQAQTSCPSQKARAASVPHTIFPLRNGALVLPYFHAGIKSRVDRVLESCVTTINGRIAKPDTVIRNGDRIENALHRHEPLVTSQPATILHEDLENEFTVSQSLMIRRTLRLRVVEVRRGKGERQGT